MPITIPTLPSQGNTDWYAHYTALHNVAAGVATARTGIRLVAGSGEPQAVKDLCDYACDGTADEVQINAAMADLTPSLGAIGTSSGGTMGGLVLLVGRQFNIAGPILLRHYCTLKGAYGAEGTWINATGYAPGVDNGFIELADGNQQYTTIEDLGLDGAGASVSGVYISMATGYEWDGNHKVRRMFIRDMGQDGIHFDNQTGGRLRNNHVSEINIIDCGRYGLNIDAPDGFYEQIHILSCGSHGVYLNHANNRLVGVKSCFSDGSGFFLSGAGRDNQLSACEAQDNEQHGYYVNGKQMTLSSCCADSNSWISGGGNQGLYDGFHLTAQANAANIHGSATDKNESGRGYHQRYGVYITGAPKVIVNVTTAMNFTGSVSDASGAGSVVNVVDSS